MSVQDLFNAVAGVVSHNQHTIATGWTVGTSAFHSTKVARVVIKHVKDVKNAANATTATSTAQTVEKEVENVAEQKGFRAFLKTNGGTISKSVTAAGALWGIFNIVHSTMKEKGNFIEKDREGGTRLGHKGQRLIGSTATAAPALLASGFQLFGTTATTTTAVAGTEVAVAGGATLATNLATAGLPLAVAGTTWLVSQDVNMGIDTTRTYEAVDAKFVPGTHAVKHPQTASLASKYDNLLPVASQLSKYMKDGNMAHPPARGADGRILHIKDLDLTQGRNRAELRRVIADAIRADQQTIDNNSSFINSVVPACMLFTSSFGRQNDAKMDMHMLQAADTELTQLGQEVNAARRAQKPQGPTAKP